MENNTDDTDFKLLMHDGLKLVDKYIKAHPGIEKRCTELYIRSINPLMAMTSDGKCHEGPILVCDGFDGSLAEDFEDDDYDDD